MVGWSVVWEDGTGQPLAELPDPGFDPRILDLVEEPSACLRFVDSTGDTVFNRLQFPVLMEELEAAGAATSDSSLQEAIRALLSFLERGRGETHWYIRIRGLES